MSSKINSIEEQPNDNIITTLGNIDNHSIALYIVIFVVCIFIAKFVRISLSLIFFIAVAFLISYLIFSRKKTKQIPHSDEQQIKLDSITPRPQRIDNYPEIIDFLYDVREFYNLNPNAFYMVVQNVDNFMQLYDQIMHNKMIYCTENLEVANEFARNAKNHFHSIIYNLDVDNNITTRFHKTLRQFELLLYQYTKQMINKCNSDFSPENISNTSKYYDEYGPRPFNYFDNDVDENFQFY